MRKYLELCRPGVYLAGSKRINVTLSDLQDAVETFKGSVPLTIGHEQNEKMPKMGNVESAAMVGETLAGVVNFNDIGGRLYEKGYYDGVSVCLKRGADGKYYIHHVAGCGEVPPAVKGLGILADLDLSDPSLETVQFTEPAGEDDLIILSSGKTDKEKGKMGKTVEELERELAAEKAKNTSLESEKAILLSDKEQGVAREKAAVTARIRKAAEGKIPAGKMNDLVALADALPADPVEVTDEAGKKEKITLGELLERIIAEVKNLVESGEPINLSDPAKPGDRDGTAGSGLLGCM